MDDGDDDGCGDDARDDRGGCCDCGVLHGGGRGASALRAVEAVWTRVWARPRTRA